MFCQQLVSELGCQIQISGSDVDGRSQVGAGQLVLFRFEIRILDRTQRAIDLSRCNKNGDDVPEL